MGFYQDNKSGYAKCEPEPKQPQTTNHNRVIGISLTFVCSYFFATQGTLVFHGNRFHNIAKWNSCRLMIVIITFLQNTTILSAYELRALWQGRSMLTHALRTKKPWICDKSKVKIKQGRFCFATASISSRIPYYEISGFRLWRHSPKIHIYI